MLYRDKKVEKENRSSKSRVLASYRTEIGKFRGSAPVRISSVLPKYLSCKQASPVTCLLTYITSTDIFLYVSIKHVQFV